MINSWSSDRSSWDQIGARHKLEKTSEAIGSSYGGAKARAKLYRTTGLLFWFKANLWMYASYIGITSAIFLKGIIMLLVCNIKYKKGKKTVPQNYRPVNLTCILCKIMESIIRDHVIDHMTTNKLFSDKQFGFISGRSTTLQLLHVVTIWCEILDEGGTIDVIYCDFMKAFDKVPHRRLLFKIERYGITENVHGWIKSFLTGRTQCVSINNVYSEPAAVTSGIPQGSVLGPILFVININDMLEVVDKDSQVFLFADDTKVFRQIRNDNDVTQL